MWTVIMRHYLIFGLYGHPSWLRTERSEPARIFQQPYVSLDQISWWRISCEFARAKFDGYRNHCHLAWAWAVKHKNFDHHKSNRLNAKWKLTWPLRCIRQRVYCYIMKEISLVIQYASRRVDLYWYICININIYKWCTGYREY